MNKWKRNILSNVTRYKEWAPFIFGDKTTWGKSKEKDRGFDNTNALQDVWKFVRDYAGLQSIGCSYQTYIQVRDSYKPNPDISIVDHYYILRNLMEDSLICRDGCVT